MERWNIGAWGDACGPRPSDRAFPGGQAIVRVEGAELVVSGVGAIKTTDCWEALPKGSRTTHTVGDRHWQNRCTSAPNDPRRATIVTTINATDNTISFDETGEYQLLIQDQTCTASVRRSRTYSSVQQAGEPPLTVAQPDPSAATPRPSEMPAPTGAALETEHGGKPECAHLGDPARVEVKPSRKLLKPGDRFSFRAVVLDAKGCPLAQRPIWSIVGTATGVSVLPSGAVTIADEAPEGRAELFASVAGRGAHIFVDIASPSHYTALLADPRGDAGTGDDVAVGVLTSTALGGTTAIAEDTIRERKTLFVIVVGLLALGLGALGFVLLRKRAPGPPAKREETPSLPPLPAVGPSVPPPPPAALSSSTFQPAGQPPAGPPPSGPPVSGPPVAGQPLAIKGSGLICRSCGNEFPVGSGFCPYDGNRLVPNPSSAPPEVGADDAMVCPSCGRSYAPGLLQCPADGNELLSAAAYEALRAPRPRRSMRGKICPTCGGRYDTDASFCGKDGTALVLVNS